MIFPTLEPQSPRSDQCFPESNLSGLVSGYDSCLKDIGRFGGLPPPPPAQNRAHRFLRFYREIRIDLNDYFNHITDTSFEACY